MNLSITLPELHDSATTTVKFTAGGKDYSATVMSLHTAEGVQALRRYGAMAEKFKDQLTETVTPVDGVDYTEEVPTELGVKLEAAFSGWLIKETDCDVIADALLSSKALRDAMYGASAALQAEFIAKKKSSSSTSPEK